MFDGIFFSKFIQHLFLFGRALFALSAKCIDKIETKWAHLQKQLQYKTTVAVTTAAAVSIDDER